MQLNHYNEMRGIYHPTLASALGKPPVLIDPQIEDGVTAKDILGYVGVAKEVISLIKLWQDEGGDPAQAKALQAQLNAMQTDNKALQNMLAQMQAQLAAQKKKKGVEGYLPWIIGGVAVLGLVAFLATRK